MTADHSREWRESLGAYALGHLSDDERAGLEAHLEGCPECRAELESLSSVARLLPLADPEQLDTPPSLPRGLGDRVMASIAGERRRSRRRRFRFGFGAERRDRGGRRGGDTGDLRAPGAARRPPPSTSPSPRCRRR